MDHKHILAIISALSGPPSPDPFAALRVESAKPGSVVSIEACPRPLPAGEIEGATLICGRIDVPEERGKPGGRTLGLAFGVLKATSRFPEPDPLVYLQGGPGGSALAIFPKLEQAFRPWRARRDVVIFDQRSAGLTGISASCTAALSQNVVEIARPGGTAGEGGIASPDLMKTCVAELERRGVPLAAYDTTQNALDVPLVAKALGYGDYNIYGISYGTKLALEVMRSAPQGVRAVIIDGVAPPWVKLYESFALKFDEAIQHVVDQCAADKACDDAYPDLGRVFRETLDKAEKDELRFRGEKVSVASVLGPVISRNGNTKSTPVTRFIPAYVYELWRGKEAPTVEMLVAAGLDVPGTDEAAVLKAAEKLDAERKSLIWQLLDNSAIVARAEQGSERAVASLRDATENASGFGPIARLFDRELAGALTDTMRGEKDRMRAVLVDYAAMQTATPDKALLLDFVAKHFSGAAAERLTALVSGMNPREVEGSFAIIRRDVRSALDPFVNGLYLDVYACQEDAAFDSYAGYQATTARLNYPHLGALTDDLAKRFFDSCAALKPRPRENWRVPVKSSIPTLSFGGLFDTQTPASWARVATQDLSDAQAFLIPEAGHGAVLYQPCVAEMGVAFIDNPKRRFDDACAHSIKVDWHIAPWVKGAKK